MNAVISADFLPSSISDFTRRDFRAHWWIRCPSSCTGAFMERRRHTLPRNFCVCVPPFRCRLSSNAFDCLLWSTELSSRFCILVFGTLPQDVIGPTSEASIPVMSDDLSSCVLMRSFRWMLLLDGVLELSAVVIRTIKIGLFAYSHIQVLSSFKCWLLA